MLNLINRFRESIAEHAANENRDAQLAQAKEDVTMICEMCAEQEEEIAEIILFGGIE